MKSQKIKIIASSLVLVLLCGCGKTLLPNQSRKTGDLSAGGSSETVTNSANTNSASTPGKTPGKESNGEHDGVQKPDAGEFGQVIYKNAPEAILKLVQKSGEEIVICDNMPSPPSVSPDGKKIAYLTPYEWEVLSDVFIYHSDKNKNENVVNGQKLATNKNIKEQFTPKKVVWLDNRYLLVIIQFAYGTVTQGGDLYVYDSMEDSLRLLIKMHQTEQINHLKVEEDIIYLDLILYPNEPRSKQQGVKMFARTEQVYEAIRRKDILYSFDMYFVSEMEDVLNTYKEISSYRFSENEPYQEISTDLNEDGNQDTIKYQLAAGNDHIYVLKVNDKEIAGFGHNLDDNPYLVDIDENDGLKEIAIQELGPSNDGKTHFYCYTGGELRYMGSVNALCAENDRITGNGTVVAPIRPFLLQTWFVTREYKLDNNHLLEGIENELYPIAHESEPLKLKTNLTLYDKPKSKNAVSVLKPGDTLKLLGCDGVEWCLGQTETGTSGWFAVDGYNVRENNLYVEDVFEGLVFAD